MVFFNKQAEVISVELTQYGKYLLSRGKFKPVYYEFSDEDILYDSNYANITETRNNISDRLKSETPCLRSQYIFSGVESNLKKLTKRKVQLEKERKKAVKYEELVENSQVREKLYHSTSPIGTSNLDDTVPSLNFNSYNIDISSVSLYKQNNSHIVNIPEITLKDINHSSSILTATETQISGIERIAEPSTLGIESVNLSSKIFKDNSFISIEDRSVLLQFFEDNVKNIGDNFEIEIFTNGFNSDGSEFLNQLYFDKTNGASIEDSNKVEYYFDIITDNDISKKDKVQVQTKKQEQVFKNNK